MQPEDVPGELVDRAMTAVGFAVLTRDQTRRLLAAVIPLIEAREREACVAAAGLAAWRHEGDDAISKAMDSAAIEQLQSCIDAIRARGGINNE